MACSPGSASYYSSYYSESAPPTPHDADEPASARSCSYSYSYSVGPTPRDDAAGSYYTTSDCEGSEWSAPQSPQPRPMPPQPQPELPPEPPPDPPHQPLSYATALASPHMGSTGHQQPPRARQPPPAAPRSFSNPVAGVRATGVPDKRSLSAGTATGPAPRRGSGGAQGGSPPRAMPGNMPAAAKGRPFGTRAARDHRLLACAPSRSTSFDPTAAAAVQLRRSGVISTHRAVWCKALLA